MLRRRRCPMSRFLKADEASNLSIFEPPRLQSNDVPEAIAIGKKVSPLPDGRGGEGSPLSACAGIDAIKAASTDAAA
jgi:hypothetical protein